MLVVSFHGFLRLRRCQVDLQIARPADEHVACVARVLDTQQSLPHFASLSLATSTCTPTQHSPPPLPVYRTRVSRSSDSFITPHYCKHAVRHRQSLPTYFFVCDCVVFCLTWASVSGVGCTRTSLEIVNLLPRTQSEAIGIPQLNIALQCITSFYQVVV